MKSDSTQSAKELAFLLAEAQKHAYSFSGDAGEIIYLFFAAKLSVADMSEIYDIPPGKINKTISDFLVGLFTKSKRFQEFLSAPSATDERTGEICTEPDSVMAELKEGRADSLIASCKAPDSLGDRIRDVVGTAIRIGMPVASTKFTAETISKMGIVSEPSTSYGVKFPVKLKEADFSLGKPRVAADATVAPAAKTCSDGTVFVERSSERVVEVDFHIALRDKAALEYEITFRNLPSWVTPVSFSFVGPDEAGNVKEYKLPTEFRNGRLYFKVENEEQENAFLNSTEVYVGFIVSEHSQE